MKTLSPFMIGAALVSTLNFGISQTSALPDAEIYDLDGISINAQSISNDSLPMILVFWKTTDNKCCENLAVIDEAWQNQLLEYGIKLVAICEDCSGDISHIKPYVAGHGIMAEVYIDKNGNLRRKMAIPAMPYTILFDRDMNIQCQSAGYCPGAEEILCEKVIQCLDEVQNRSIAVSEE